MIAGASMKVKEQKLKGGYIRIIHETDDGEFVSDEIFDFEKYRELFFGKVKEGESEHG